MYVIHLKKTSYQRVNLSLLVLFNFNGVQESPQPPNVFREFTRTISDIIMPPVPYPPGITLQMTRNGSMQIQTVAHVHFLVKLAVNYHDGAFDLFDPINVWVNVQTG